MPTVDEAIQVLASGEGLSVEEWLQNPQRRLGIKQIRSLIGERLEAGATLEDFASLKIVPEKTDGIIGYPKPINRFELVEVSPIPDAPTSNPAADPREGDIVAPGVSFEDLPAPQISGSPMPGKSLSPELQALADKFGVDLSRFDTGESEALSEGKLVNALFAVDETIAGEVMGALREPLGSADKAPFAPQKILNLQQNLVAAGYLSAKAAQNLTPGWYDGITAKAYARLLVDARLRGVDATTALSHRLALNGAYDASAVLGDDIDVQAYEKAKKARYKQVWGQAAPPGYVERFADLNPDEFEAFEKAKDSWQSSKVADAEKQILESQVLNFLSSAGERPLLPKRRELGLD